MRDTYPSARRRAPCLRLRVLVVAPHPDDDAIGCGATLARLAERGARVGVVYVTDGGASHVKSKRFPPAALRVVREGEARAALRTLGVRGEPLFLRAPDGELQRLGDAERGGLVAALAARMVALRTQIVLAPWPRDPHPDHVATAAIVRDALAVCGRYPAVYFYHVWLPVRGDAAEYPQRAEVAVHDVALTARDIERKRAAIMAHRSQTGMLVDDDPDGFRIDDAMLAAWLTPVERFYRREASEPGRSIQ